MSLELGEQEQNLVSDIVRLFKNQGEILLCDEGKLTLQASALVIVNHAFETIIHNDDDFETSFEATPANTEKIPHLHNVQMLYDFVQKLRRLKVSHHYQSLSGYVNVTAFRALRHLELKRVGLHLVSGLSKICGHLETIAFTKCVDSLEDLFERCGGDKSSPLSWSNLQAVYLRENSIKALDTSLRLVPMVRVLDLSHNNIHDTMNYLECLSELSMLNLNYNKVYRIPMFNLSCKHMIQVLLLRYNMLSQIDGIQELTGLTELDLRGNLIAAHSLLKPLKALSRITMLRLFENPLCYHKNHRGLAVQYIHPIAAKVVSLDGKCFTKKELKLCNNTVPMSYVRPTRQELLVDHADFDLSVERSLAYDASFYDATTPSEGEIQVTSVKVSKKKKVPTATLR